MTLRVCERFGIDPHSLADKYSEDEIRVLTFHEQLRMNEEQRETEIMAKAIAGFGGGL